MLRFKLFVLVLCILSFAGLSAEIYGNMIGGEPAESWEDGGQDFFVMFNSNIDDQIVMFGDDPENPQGDTCVDSSSFTLTDFHIPTDAIIEKAYIVWMGAVDPSKIDSPTDNTVNLSFAQVGESGVSHDAEIVGADDGAGNGKLLPEDSTSASFEFEGMKFTDDVEVGCSETTNGSIENDQTLGYFTYRVDITDFFDNIKTKNAEAGNTEEGMYYGDYTFSGLDCTEHDNYRCKTTMVSAWAVFFVYRSSNIRPKKIYLYNGLAFVQGDKSVAEVSGFELPKYPVVRLTSMIAEGDPKLVDTKLPAEGIFLQGEGATSLFRLYNECNPMQGNYVEVFNSISSVVNWDPDAEDTNQTQCVSGPEDATVNFGIDVDTFLLNSEENINLQEHLKKGNTGMEITLSVNQDAIFTNFMVLSVDNKGSNFDIPEEASDPTKSKWNFPNNREKHFCGCPSTDEGKVADYYCEETTGFREFYYMIKIQNWGDEDAENVVVSDELDGNLEYVPGSTEYATHLVKGASAADDTYDDWEVIQDKAGGVFPLSGDGYKIAAKMANCDQDAWACSDTIMVRYKVKPKTGTSKNYVFENIAVISDDKSEEPYKSNRSYPLKLAPTTCVPDTQCKTATKLMCGGEREDKKCDESNPCPDGYVCNENNECENDPAKTCLNSTAAFDIGKNSPISEGSEIVIPKDNNKQPLVVGQFTVQVSNCTKDKFYNLDAVTVHVDKDGDNYFQFTDLELIHDKDGNGVVDATDTVLSRGDITDNYVKFFVPVPEDESNEGLGLKKITGEELNYFIVRTNVDYSEEKVNKGTTFHFYLESATSIEISDLGTAFVEANDVEFASYMLEPTGDFFVATIGPNDPPVPSLEEMTGDIPVLQIRTKALTKANTIESIKIKTPVSGGYVKFGEKNGIEAISLYLDSSKDGVGNVKVAEITEFDTITTSIEFKDFLQNITYLAGEEKYLVVNLKLNMVSTPEGEDPMAAKIEISKISLSDNSVDTVELPIKSKAFIYECKPGDPNCAIPEPDDPEGCSCSVVSVGSRDNAASGILIVLLLSAMLGSLYLSRKQS